MIDFLKFYLLILERQEEEEIDRIFTHLLATTTGPFSSEPSKTCSYPDKCERPTLLAILQRRKLDSDLWQSWNLWGSKVHCHAVPFGLAQGRPPTRPTSSPGFLKATVVERGDCRQRAAPTVVLAGWGQGLASGGLGPAPPSTPPLLSQVP